MFCSCYLKIRNQQFYIAESAVYIAKKDDARHHLCIMFHVHFFHIYFSSLQSGFVVFIFHILAIIGSQSENRKLQRHAKSGKQYCWYSLRRHNIFKDALPLPVIIKLLKRFQYPRSIRGEGGGRDMK